MNIIDIILTGFLIACTAFIVYYIFKEQIEAIDSKNIYTIDYICDEVKRIINSIINMDIDVFNLNKKDLENRRMLKRTLSDALRKCSQGDMAAKLIVFTRIKNILANKLNLSEDDLNKIIAFNDENNLSSLDKFEIMMYLEKRNRNTKYFQSICEKTGIDNLKKDNAGYYYKITQEDIDKAYKNLAEELTYDDKLNILTQRVYELTYGLSVVDMFIMEDDSIDNVSGGISGITREDLKYLEEELFTGSRKPRTYESVWVTYEGKPIHMEFLSFRSKSEIIRICKNMAEHGRTGHITSAEGGIKTHLANGCRTTIFRPNNASSWAFFVRKLNNTKSLTLEELLTDEGKEYPIGVIKWAIKGCVNIFFAGDQNSGKTTNLRAAIKYIDKRQPIRTLEADFELCLNNEYSDLNILGTRPSEKLPFEKVIELLKSSEAHTIIFGETASLEHARHSIDLLLAGTKRIITTGHWNNARDMVSYHVHALGGYSISGSGEIEAFISELTHLFIQCVKENDGHRHIQKITEIIPYEDDVENSEKEGLEGKIDEMTNYLRIMARRKTYYTRDIVIYKNGKYEMINPISDRLSEIILNNLSEEDKKEYKKFNKIKGKRA